MIGILRIKDAEGNWQEIEAIRGPKGEDGTNYVLTAEDRTEIAGMVNADGDGLTILEDENGKLSTAIGGYKEEKEISTIYESSAVYSGEDTEEVEGELDDEESEMIMEANPDFPATVYITINDEERVYEDVVVELSNRMVELFIETDEFDTVEFDIKNNTILFIMMEAGTYSIGNLRIEQGGVVYYPIDKNYLPTGFIQEMIDNSTPDVDLSDYYTRDEIDNLLANMPAGDIPSGEEVGF